MIDLRIALHRIADLQRSVEGRNLQRVGYPDGERRPRIPRHWANR